MQANENDFLSVVPEAKVVYVLVAAREKFDQIPLPAMEHDLSRLSRFSVGGFLIV
jgi:hypothetical protein